MSFKKKWPTFGTLPPPPPHTQTNQYAVFPNTTKVTCNRSSQNAGLPDTTKAMCNRINQNVGLPDTTKATWPLTNDHTIFPDTTKTTCYWIARHNAASITCYLGPLQYQLLGKPWKYNFASKIYPFSKRSVRKICTYLALTVAFTLSEIGTKAETCSRTRTMGIVPPTPWPVWSVLCESFHTVLHNVFVTNPWVLPSKVNM